MRVTILPNVADTLCPSPRFVDHFHFSPWEAQQSATWKFNPQVPFGVSHSNSPDLNLHTLLLDGFLGGVVQRIPEVYDLVILGAPCLNDGLDARVWQLNAVVRRH